jgi:hypothetical protein
MTSPRIFVLSPARLDGPRAKFLFEPVTLFPVARALRSSEGAELGEIFRFVSGLYFRGKLTYAKTFARPPEMLPALGTLVITQNRGLLPPDTRVSLAELTELGKTGIRSDETTFREPLLRDARAIARAAPNAEVVLLGSVATDKYVTTLLEVFGERLLFPADFVGRGDMSRGALLLRAAAAGKEIDLIAVAGAKLRGARPPKLPPARSRTRGR